MRICFDQECGSALVMCGTILVAPSLYLEWEVRTDEQEGRLISCRHWRCDTTRTCCPGWRSPTLDRSGFAGPNIFATQGYPRERTDVASWNTPSSTIIGE